MIDANELRNDLKAARKRNPDAIQVISAVSGIEQSKIEKFAKGEDSLNLVEMMNLNMLK